MEQVIPSNIVELSDKILALIPKDIKTMVDMTLGNGHDSLKLLNHFPEAKLIGFDIQELAIKNTKETLKNIPSSRYDLILDSHENIDKYVDNLDLVLYNLGYLPKSDKSVVTKAKSTLKSLQSSLKLLNVGGLIFIIFYVGHDGGMEEYNISKDFLKVVNQRYYNIIEINYLNQINNPPRLVCIERIR